MARSENWHRLFARSVVFYRRTPAHHWVHRIIYSWNRTYTAGFILIRSHQTIPRSYRLFFPTQAPYAPTQVSKAD